MDGNIHFKSYPTIYQVKKYWQKIIRNDDHRIYQTYLFNKICFESRIFSFSNILKRNKKCCFIVAFKDNEPICIAPLNIDVNPEISISLLGSGTNAGYLDFIYSEEVSEIDILEVLNKCRKKFTNAKFDFLYVKKTSPLFNVLRCKSITKNYAIHLNTYDEYFSSLSKSTRQNIRTANNRIKNDELNFNLLVYDKNSSCLEKVIKKVNVIYQKRRTEWNRINQFPSPYKMKRIQKRDVVYHSMRKIESSIIVVLEIEEHICAFFMGYKFSNIIYIPRLAIDTKYSRYSVGILLINEYLKTISGTDNEFIFDLGRGEEQYKTTLKGELTITYRLS